MNTNGTKFDVPRRTGRRWLAAAVFGLLLAVPTPALAQWSGIRLGKWDARLELDADFGRESTERAAGPFKLRRRLLQERFVLRNTGLIVGRRLLVLRGGISLGLQQSDAANTVTTSSSSGAVDSVTSSSVRGKVLNYDIGLDVMPAGAYQLNANMSRNSSNTDLRFGTSTVVATDIQNAALRLTRVPMSPLITARRFHIDRASRSGTRVTRSIETRKLFGVRAAESWKWQSLSLSWSFDDIVNELSPGLSNPTHAATLTHSLRLPFLASDGLQTNVQGFRRGGSSPLKQLDITETLRFQILPSLASSLSYNFNERHRGDEVFVTTGATLGLWHQLYQSLSTSVSTGATLNRMPTGRQSSYTMLLNLNYRKNIIGGGRFIGRYSRAYQLQDNAFSEREVEIADERHVGRIGAPFALLEPHVVEGSVLVTDQSKVVIYQENADYLVDYIGDLAEITVTPEGRIEDGQPLLVTYDVLAPAQTRVGRHNQSWAISLDYTWIMPYFQSSKTRQDLLEGDDEGLLSPSDRSTMGLKLRLNSARFRAIASGQYETLTSRSSAFNRVSFNEFFGYQFDNGATISVNLSQSRQDATIPARVTRRALGRITARWQPQRALSFNVLMNARLWDDSTGRGETYYEAGFGARFSQGRFVFDSSLRYFWTVRNGIPRKGLRATLALTRRF